MYAIAVAAACAFLAPPAAQLARMPPRVRRALTPRCVRDDFDLEVPTLDTSTLRIGSVEPADMEQWCARST